MVRETKYKAVRARFVLPLWDKDPDERIEDGYVLCEDQRIVEVGAYREEIGQALRQRYGEELTLLSPSRALGVGGAEVQAEKEGPGKQKEALEQINGVLLPAFVKAHGHDHEQLLIGVAKDEPLTAWLDHAVNPFTSFLNKESATLAARFGEPANLIAYRLARICDIYYGITASMVHHCNFNKYHLAEIAQANEEAQTTMLVAVGSQDRFYYEALLDTPEEALRRLEEARERFGQLPFTRFLPGPDQFFSNSERLLVPLKEWSRRHDTLFHIHSSEEPKTTRWFQEEIEPGDTPIEYATRLGILDQKTVVAHQVNCGARDIELLQKSGAAVVHNPLANTILGSGMPPLMEMLQAGIPVAISTDGSGSADNQNILNAARTAAQYQKAAHQDATLLPAGQLLQMITRVPAHILGMNKGKLQPGADADFVVVDLSRPNLIPTRRDNVVENLIWAADGSEILYVVGNGRLMKWQGELVDFGPKKVQTMLQEGQELSELYASYREEMPEIRGTGAHQ